MFKKLWNKLTTYRDKKLWNETLDIIMNLGTPEEQDKFRALCAENKAFTEVGFKIVPTFECQAIIKPIIDRNLTN